MKHILKFSLNILTLGVVSFGLVIAGISFSSFANQEVEAAISQNNMSLAKDLLIKQSNKEFWQARIALKEKRLDDAEELFSAALALNKTNADYHFWYGLVNLRQASNASIFSAPSYASTGKEHLLKALELNPRHLKALQSMLQYSLNAPAIVGGSTKKAFEYAEEIAAIDKNKGQFEKLKIYRHQNDDKNEKEMALNIVNATATNGSALLAAGFSLQKFQEFSLATTAFSKVISFKSPTANKHNIDLMLQAQYQIGKTAVLAENNLTDGINALENYLDQELSDSLPDKGWAKYRLANLYWLTKNNQRAQTLLKEVINETSDKRLKQESKLLNNKIVNG